MKSRIDLVRSFATGMVDGFMCDLVLAEERKQAPSIGNEDELIDAFKAYVANPESIFAAKVAA
jgi:hypothetical protein